MTSKIKIYCDTGADTSKFKSIAQHIDFYQFPYDSPDRPKKNRHKLAKPSEAQWRDAHITWDESDCTFEDFSSSAIRPAIEKIVNKPNRRDILHLDSAYKTKCQVFLTTDKDIYLKRQELEEICGFRIFNPQKEWPDLEKYVLTWINQQIY